MSMGSELQGGSLRVFFTGNNSSSWNINPDGKRFLMMKGAGSTSSEGGDLRRINVVANWLDELNGCHRRETMCNAVH